MQFVPPRFVRFLAPGKPDDAESRRHQLVLAQVVERGDEFARREIAAGAEDDDGARLRQFALYADVANLPLELFIHSETMAQPPEKFNLYDEVSGSRFQVSGDMIFASHFWFGSVW